MRVSGVSLTSGCIYTTSACLEHFRDFCDCLITVQKVWKAGAGGPGKEVFNLCPCGRVVWFPFTEIVRASVWRFSIILQGMTR